MAPTHRRMQTGGWKSASALALIPLLFSASGGTAGTITQAGENVIPRVPSRPYDQPASVVQPAAVVVYASPVTPVAAVAAEPPADIPAVALSAYRRTELLLSDADPTCKLDWTLVAAIGRVESDHGRTGGNTLGADGVARPGIYGIPLDGSKHTAKIHDTDDGKFDADKRWDRAVGPMQFIPGTWTQVAIDSDVDGKSDPQNIFDATAATGVYLCAGNDDLATVKGARNAVLRYNHSDAYVDKVLAIARQYAKGSFVDPTSTLYATPALQASLPLALVEVKRQAKVMAQRVTDAEKPKPATTRPTSEPVDPPVEQKPADPVEQKPADPVAEEPADPPAVPVDPPVAVEPTDPPVAVEPTDPPVALEPTDPPVALEPTGDAAEQ